MITLCLRTVQRCVELVSRSRKPVILVGSQATLPPVQVNDLRKALEVRLHISYMYFSFHCAEVPSFCVYIVPICMLLKITYLHKLLSFLGVLNVIEKQCLRKLKCSSYQLKNL